MSHRPSVLLSYVVVDDGKREARTRPCLRTLRGKACEEITLQPRKAALWEHKGLMWPAVGGKAARRALTEDTGQ